MADELLRSKHGFGAYEDVSSAIESGAVDEHDLLLTKDAEGNPHFGWVEKDGNPIFLDTDTSEIEANVEALESEIASKANSDEVNAKIAEVDTKVDSVKEEVLADVDAKIEDQDAKNLQSAKDYADSLAVNYDAAGSAATAKAEAIADADAKVQALADGQVKLNKEAIERLNGDATTEGSVTKAIADAKAVIDGDIDAVEAKADKNAEDIAAINDADTGILAQAKADAQSKADAVQENVDALDEKVGELPEGTTATSVVDYINKKTEGIATDVALGELNSQISGLQTAVQDIQKDYLVEADKTELQGNIDDVDGKVDEVAGKVATLVGEDTGKSARTIANEELAKQLIAEGAKESLDTLAEIAAWIQSHPDDASAMNKAIEDLEALIGVLPEGVTATTVIGYVQEVVATETSAREEAISELDERLQAVENKFGEGEGNVEAQIAAAKQEAIDTAAGDATTKANQALTDAKVYTDSLAGNYATAEQGTLADSALQKEDITTGSANGTIAVDGTDVEVKGLGSAAYADTTAFDAAGVAEEKVNTLANGAVADNTAAIAAINNVETGILKQAKDYVDTEVKELADGQVATNTAAITALQTTHAEDKATLQETKVDKKELENYALKNEIPTVPVQSVNGKTGAVQLSASEVGALPNSTKIPANTSDLTNNSGFITKTVTDLANYYLKTEVYTQEEIDNKLSAIPKFAIEVVSTLPTANISETTVYLIASGNEEHNLYTEYIYVDGQWEYLGKQTVDLTNYVKRAELSNYYLKSEMDSLLTTIRNSIPTQLSQFTEDSTHRTVTDTEKKTWNAKSNFSGAYGDLTGKPTIPTKTSQLTNDSNFVDKSVTDNLSDTIVALPDNLSLVNNVAEVVKAEVPLVKTAEQPTFVNSVDEMTDTSKVYVMSDGTNACFYAYMEGIIVTPLTANLFESGGIFSGNGEDAVVTATLNRIRTGQVQCTTEHPISIVCNSTAKWLVHFYKNGTWLGKTNMVSNSCENVAQLWSSPSDVTHVRILLGYVSDANVTDIADLLSNVTITQRGDSGKDWRSTGIAYNQPADYEDRIVALENAFGGIAYGTY